MLRAGLQPPLWSRRQAGFLASRGTAARTRTRSRIEASSAAVRDERGDTARIAEHAWRRPHRGWNDFPNTGLGPRRFGAVDAEHARLAGSAAPGITIYNSAVQPVAWAGRTSDIPKQRMDGPS